MRIFLNGSMAHVPPFAVCSLLLKELFKIFKSERLFYIWSKCVEQSLQYCHVHVLPFFSRGSILDSLKVCENYSNLSLIMILSTMITVIVSLRHFNNSGQLAKICRSF